MDPDSRGESRQICSESGMDGYVSRPITKALLNQEIERVMALRGGL